MSRLILGRSVTAPRTIGFTRQAKVDAGELVTYSGDGHLVTFAPTGTGKTSGPVITNALSHPGQLIVLDMKGEVFAATAEARRAMGQDVRVIDLRDGSDSDSLNPLDLAALSGTDPAVTGRSFAAELIERPAEERDRFWNDWSETMIAGGTAWLLADQPVEERRLSTLFDVFTDDDVNYRLAVLLDQKKVTNRAARAAFASFLQLPERETRPSVLGSVQSHLRLFDSDLVRRLTDTTTLDIDGFLAGKPMTLYIIVPPFRLQAYRPLLRLWLSGLLLLLTQRRHPPNERTRKPRTNGGVAYGDNIAEGKRPHRMVVLAKRCATPDLRHPGKYHSRQCRRNPDLWNQKLPHGSGSRECRRWHLR
jgi:type IV secretion system protein VirD4